MGKPSWAWVTGAQVLAKGPCKLHYAALAPSAAAADITVYNGENATEPPVVKIEAATQTLTEFRPPQPVELDRGLYISIGSHVTGVFVQYEPGG